MREREQLRKILDLAAVQPDAPKISSAEDFLALLKYRHLAGPQKLSRDAETVITGYVGANLAGGKPLDAYVTEVLAAIPESEFDRTINPETDITLGDAVDLARYAIARWPAPIIKNNTSTENLPLAV